MPAPLVHIVGEYLRNPKVRRIDYEYHIQCIAEHSERNEALARQIRDNERAHLAVSIHHAVSQYDQLRSIDADLGRIADAISGIGSLIEVSTETIIDAVDSLGDLLIDGFETVRTEIERVHETMHGIDQKIARQYETRARELRKCARTMMLHGMQGDKCDRKENYRDALNLYRVCARNPVSRIDRQTQFDLGWLEWKVNHDYEQAKKHFRRAWRLSRNDNLPNDIQIRIGRHHAYMCYRLKEYGNALKALKSLDTDANPKVMLDMARCLWKIRYEYEEDVIGMNQMPITFVHRYDGREDARKLLREVLELYPERAFEVLTDPDFHLDEEVQRLAASFIAKTRAEKKT